MIFRISKKLLLITISHYIPILISLSQRHIISWSRDFSLYMIVCLNLTVFVRITNFATLSYSFVLFREKSVFICLETISYYKIFLLMIGVTIKPFTALNLSFGLLHARSNILPSTCRQSDFTCHSIVRQLYIILWILSFYIIYWFFRISTRKTLTRYNIRTPLLNWI